MNQDAGQLIFTGIHGIALDQEEKQFLESENIGGVILFEKNYESPAQLAELVNNIQKLRREYPLFIGVDQEGGRVRRFKKHFTQFPAMAEIAKLGSPKICFFIHKIMAEELGVCGVNVNFSPCCDILTNKSTAIGDRSFGSSPDIVNKYITAAIRGLQTNGVLACAKHFPGHGATSKDSHLELPVVKIDMEELAKIHINPFVRAIKSSRVEFLMMGHMLVDAFDKDLPISLSLKAHEYVRKDLKHNKIIISDDMQMDAILSNYSLEESVLHCLNAGTDMLLYRDMEHAQKALMVIHNALKVKKIKNDQVNEKVKRIIGCKKNYFSEYQPVYIPKIDKKINSKASQIFLDDILDRISKVK